MLQIRVGFFCLFVHLSEFAIFLTMPLDLHRDLRFKFKWLGTGGAQIVCPVWPARFALCANGPGCAIFAYAPRINTSLKQARFGKRR
jgi:hypothetical protein